MARVSEEHMEMMRKKILKSTYRLFVSEGDRMTTKMVCDDAHVSKGTLFHYFQSKDLLLQTAFREAHAHAACLSQADIDMSAPDKQIVWALVRNSLKWGMEFPDEVNFSERYNDAMHNSLASSSFSTQVAGMFDHPPLRERLLRGIPQSYHEYVMISASTLAFHLVVYITHHPEKAQDVPFIDFSTERIWRIFQT